MMEEKVVYEVKLSKPVMAIASVAALGLLLIGLKPVLEVTPAFASNDVTHKIAICELPNPFLTGQECADINNGALNFLGR